MTLEDAAKSLKRATDRKNREASVILERYRRSIYRIQAACPHDWKVCTDGCWMGLPATWRCSACGVVSDKNPMKGLT